MAFTVFFRFISENGTSWRGAFAGATIAAPVFEVSKILFVFLAQWVFSKCSSDALGLILSAFLGVPICLIATVLIVFAGKFSEVFATAKGVTEADGKTIDGSFQYEFKSTREVAIMGMVELTRKFLTSNIEASQVGITVSHLADIADIPLNRSHAIITHLESVGLVKVFRDNNEVTAVLSFSPDKMTLNKILERIEMRQIQELRRDSVTHWFWNEYEAALSERFEHITIRSLAEKDAAVVPTDAKKSAGAK